eukprot:9462296-Lingulodinium_polyedra.AAC.1
MAALNDRDCEVKLLKGIDGESSSLLVNPITGLVCKMAGTWRLQFTNEGWGVLQHVASEDAAAEPRWVRDVL